VTSQEIFVKSEVFRILGKVFSLDRETNPKIDDVSHFGTWDSLKHVQIILELEDSFDFEVSDAEIESFFDFDSVVEFVLKKLEDK
jgi:acyl carrier protein